MQLPLGLVLQLSLRSLWAHKVKSLIVGAILFFGTFLVVMGSSLLGTINGTMAQSITSSLSGHLQVYDADAEDELALFGSMAMGEEDIGEISSFSDVAPVLEGVDNVKAVVPMAMAQATIFGESEFDRVVARIDEAAEQGDQETLDAVIPQARRIARDVRAELEDLGKLNTNPERNAESIANLERADTDAFWEEEFVQDRAAAVRFLEQEVAQLAGEGNMMWLRMIGTDLEQFTESFDRFYVVDGEAVPAGRRGVLISKRTYERIFKNKVARELDDLLEEVVDKGQVIAETPELQDQIVRNSRQYTRVTDGLDAGDAAAIEAALRKELPGVDGGLAELMQQFLLVDDSNIKARHAAFYELVAPHVRLYEFDIGDVMPLRAYTKAGYVRSVNVKIYGTYEFAGLEKSDLASASNLLDLVTFRELHGKMSAEQKEELAQIREEVGIAAVARDDAEAALFGGGDLVVQTEASTEGFAQLDDGVVGQAERLDDRVYSTEEIRDGLVLNIAVILDDPELLWQTKAAMEQAIDDAGLRLQVTDWRTASGMAGQFLFVTQAVLVIALFIIFMVALLIINNSMVMATMDRVSEIGTMRAIGARRGLVINLFIGETVMLGLLSGGAGALFGAMVLTWLGEVGIPAVDDVLVMLFAGPRLYPELGMHHLLFGMATVTVVGVISTLYPAFLAARIPPIVAMQSGD